MLLPPILILPSGTEGLELIKDYDCIIDYHPGNANVVTDAFSHKDKAIRGGPATWKEETMIGLKRLGAVLSVSPEGSLMAQLRVKSGYREQILEAQQLDNEVLKVRIKLESGGETLFRMGDDGIVMLGRCMYVPDNKTLKQKYYEKLMSLSSLFIRVVLRCTRI